MGVCQMETGRLTILRGIYMENKRFEITETAGSVKGFYVVVDRETGVNYLVAKFGTGGGICPLIDKDGKPIIKGRQQGVLPPFPIIEERGIFHD